MARSKGSLKKFEQIFHQLGYRIIYEKGSFKSGYCLVRDKKMVVINKFFDTDGRFETLLSIIGQLDFDFQKLDAKQVAFLQQHYSKEIVSGQKKLEFVGPQDPIKS